MKPEKYLKPIFSVELPTKLKQFALPLGGIDPN